MIGHGVGTDVALLFLSAGPWMLGGLIVLAGGYVVAGIVREFRRGDDV
jgi:hypothetical protein